MTTSQRARQTGQAIVETALVFAILGFAILGFLDAAILLGTHFQQDRNTYTLAVWASQHSGESWNSLANQLFAHDCSVTVAPGKVRDTLTAKVTCPYHPVGYQVWELLPVRTEQTTSIEPPSKSVSPSQSPSGSPSSSSTTARARLVA